MYKTLQLVKTREHQSYFSSQLWHSRHQKEGRDKERKKNKTKKEKKGEKDVSNSECSKSGCYWLLVNSRQRLSSTTELNAARGQEEGG